MTSVTSSADDKNMGRWTLWLALIILAAFFAFYGIALVSGIFFSSPDDFSGIEKVSATLGPLAGGVIGYYFGQRPVGEMADKLKNTAGDATQSVQKFDDSYERLRKENEDLKGTISSQKQAIELLNQAIDELKAGKPVKEGEA
jgi:hypothetical protein